MRRVILFYTVNAWLVAVSVVVVVLSWCSVCFATYVVWELRCN